MGKGDIVEIAKAKGMTPSEFGSWAGVKAKGKPKRLALRPNRKCTKACPLWPACFIKYSSAQEKYGGRCALADPNTPERVKSVIFSFLQGEEGMNNKIMELIGELEMLVRKEGTSSRNVASLIKTLAEAKVAIHGNRQRVEAKLEGSGLLSPERLLEIYEESKRKKEVEK
jgi:hypothetical protein